MPLLGIAHLNLLPYLGSDEAEIDYYPLTVSVEQTCVLTHSCLH